MGRQRRSAWGYGAFSAVALGTAVVIGGGTLPRSTAGDIDPLGAVIGLVALAASVWAGWLTMRSLHWQETNLADAAERLATEVLTVERDAWRRFLGDHHKAIDVGFTLHPAPAHDAEGASPEGHLNEVLSYYRRLRPRRMVITGAPGAGKTVLTMQLALSLLENRDSGDPVPVRLSLASWDTSQSVEVWIARHLVDVYDLPAAAASALVKARRVLPVLDGLDEMDPHPEPCYGCRAGHALRALNAYQQGLGKAEVVLTCRSRPYQALEDLRVWVQDAARVEIRPIAAATVRQFLTRRVDDLTRWQDVLDAFASHPHGPLATGLSTPWRLTLAVTVYERRDPRTGAYPHDPRSLLSPALNTADAVREHLLALFIPSVTAVYRRSRGTAYTAERVHAWLAVLASYLDRNAATGRTFFGRAPSGTDIVLHELWPLAGSRLPRAVSAAVIALIWLTGSAVVLAQVLLDVVSSSKCLFAGVLAAVIAIPAMKVAWGTGWPRPRRADLRRLRTRGSWLIFAMWLGVGLASGLAYGKELPYGEKVGVGLAYGLMLCLVFGIRVGLEASGTSGVVDPKGVVRGDLVFGLAGGLALGLVCTPILQLGGKLPSGLALVIGVTAGLTAGLTGRPAGFVGLRYVALLLCTRRWSGQWLPWRLGRFLHWCYGAGLIRVAGIAYQFRHRELQDYLARHTHHRT